MRIFVLLVALIVVIFIWAAVLFEGIHRDVLVTGVIRVGEFVYQGAERATNLFSRDDVDGVGQKTESTVADSYSDGGRSSTSPVPTAAASTANQQSLSGTSGSENRSTASESGTNQPNLESRNFEGENSKSAAEVPVTTRPFADVVSFPLRSAPAQAVSLYQSSISAEIRATVNKVHVEVGDFVEQGMELITLDCTDYVDTRDRAAVTLKSARSKQAFADYQFSQTVQLSRKGTIANESLEQSKMQKSVADLDVIQLEVDYRRAKRNARKCRIVAPFSAIVEQRFVTEGEFAEVGMPVVKIVDIARVEVHSDVQTDDIDGLNNSLDVNFVVGKRKYPLLKRIAMPVIDGRLRTREVLFSPMDRPPPPGATGTVQWRLSEPHVLPELLVYRRGEYGVFVLSGGKAQFLPIPGVEPGRPAPLLLSESHRLIVDGRFRVTDGDAVIEQ